MFTKKHYIEIAKVLRDSQDEKYVQSVQFKLCHLIIVQDFVALLEEDDSKFDAEKFLNAVYGKEEKNVRN